MQTKNYLDLGSCKETISLMEPSSVDGKSHNLKSRSSSILVMQPSEVSLAHSRQKGGDKHHPPFLQNNTSQRKGTETSGSMPKYRDSFAGVYSENTNQPSCFNNQLHN